MKKNLKYTVLILIVLTAVLIPAAVFADGVKVPDHVYENSDQAIEATKDSHETAFYFAHDMDTGQKITGKCGDNTTYTVYGQITWEQYNENWYSSSEERYLAVISGTGPTYDYTWDTKLDKWSDVREIIVEDGVTTIGDNFFNMINTENRIRKVTLPEGLLSIGEEAFCNSEFMESINLPDTITDIGYQAFFCCRNLESLHIPEGLTRIQEDSFYGLESITSIEIPDSVTTIERGGFQHCEKLAAVKWGKGLKKIGVDAFAACGFTELSIPNHVTSIGDGAFQVCLKLKKVKVSKAFTKIPEEAFYRCEKLTTITFPAASKVTTISSGAFEYCRALKTITLPKNVTKIKDESFKYCSKLTTIKLLSKKPPKLQSYCVFVGDRIFAKSRTKKMTFKCPNMSKKNKKAFRKYLKKPSISFYGKVK